ncbi:MAG: hypothetical protein ACKPB4_22850 [Sphaerospermopsis kisseleviana]
MAKQTSGFGGDWSIGTLSDKPRSFFQEIQRRIDDDDPFARCARYDGMSYNPAQQRKRRIFFGSIVEDEPWELVEIVSTESYGILEGVVLLFQHLRHGGALQEAFGTTTKVQVRAYDVDESIPPAARERMQRDEILRGWKEMGMGPDDVGYMGDLGEAFTRDFLRAVQTCELDILDYESHKCERARLISDARVYEGSPECISEKGWWQYVFVG